MSREFISLLSYSKQSTVKLQATSYQSADYETMSGTFTKEACDRDPGIVDCLSLIHI